MSARPAIKGSTILVTGGAGFIGSHLVDRLLQDGASEVVVVDNLFTGSEANIARHLGRGVSFYLDDVEIATTLRFIFDRHPIDLVFNCATKALNYSFLNPANAFAANVNAVLNILELQRSGAFSTLCHFPPPEVYGTAVYEPMDEAHPKRPTTTYAAGKAAADMAVESYVNMFGLDAFIVRPFNNYGPRQNHKGVLAGVIPITARRILTGELPEIHGDGAQSRDFIYVLDTVDAVVKLYSVLGPGEAVNISTDNQIAISDLIDEIAKRLDYTGEIVRRPARAADVLCHKASNQRVRQLIDYRLTPFDQGMDETIAYYRHQFGGSG